MSETERVLRRGRAAHDSITTSWDCWNGSIVLDTYRNQDDINDNVIRLILRYGGRKCIIAGFDYYFAYETRSRLLVGGWWDKDTPWYPGDGAFVGRMIIFDREDKGAFGEVEFLTDPRQRLQAEYPDMILHEGEMLSNADAIALGLLHPRWVDWVWE